jgi:hypothetical protein
MVTGVNGRVADQDDRTPLSVRYGTLAATINGKPLPDPDKTAAVQEWLAAALCPDSA